MRPGFMLFHMPPLRRLSTMQSPSPGRPGIFIVLLILVSCALSSADLRRDIGRWP